ncbi:conserved Plasmodium protein, unknown function [Plasmodium relictum]|uniref:Uncharacterized protein n=1 Tax=Plasmodium relictum TaxID=85471 RepID=A0A1J1HCU5_PLARL|nr:conserved Plasmodium protein, unknown function [Plasmodium relictum]CRH03800.1 conserved Plasmodium protein, unknown function [Plasmodium relictum]
MGNIASEHKKKPMTLQDLTTKIGEYRTINEGDPEMIEDPEFPKEMMLEALNKNNTIEGNCVQGTYVYYPNRRKPKMWIGNYKILNPEDILCKNVAEKLGMTEIEWKNYIKRKNTIREESGKTEKFPHFDYYSPEQSRALKEIMKNSNIDYPYVENENSGYYNDNEYFVNSPHFYNNNEMKNDYDSDKYSHNNGVITNDYSFDENIYYDKKSTKDDKIFDNSYINELNDEITKIREEQEKMIIEECKDIYAYSKSNTDHIIIPQKNGSFLIEKKNLIEYNNKNMIEELMNEKKNKINSQVRVLKEKNKKREYKNLSSMSTKGSLGLDNSNIDKNILNKNVYLNRTLVK